MGSKSILICIGILLFLFSSLKAYEATRILDEEEEEWFKKDNHLLLQSLQQGSGRTPSPNGCGFIPHCGGRKYTITTTDQNNFAGQLNVAATTTPPPSPPPPPSPVAYPQKMFQFGVAGKSR